MGDDNCKGVKLDKNYFINKIVNKLNIEKIESNVEYKYFIEDFNFKLMYLLQHKKEKLGIHIIHQFTSGTSGQKALAYFLNKFQQTHFPVLLIFIEDRIKCGPRASFEAVNMVITNKYGCYIDYNNDEKKIRMGEDILIEKIRYLLKI